MRHHRLQRQCIFENYTWRRCIEVSLGHLFCELYYVKICAIRRFKVKKKS